MSLRGLLTAGILAVVYGVASARASEPATQPAMQSTGPDSFLRFVDDGHGGGVLQSADVTFANAAGVKVDLIAAVHIGEKSYYEGLNRDFKAYDAVLYEMVKPKGTEMPPPGEVGRSNNAVTGFQRFLKSALELDFQLDDVDYTAPNFVHADLDKETFERMQEERGESFEQIMIRQILRSFTEPMPAAESTPATQPTTEPTTQESAKEFVKVFTRPDMVRQIKVMIARQMGDMDATAMGLDGPDGSVILTERNKAAMSRLVETLKKGDRKIAIFFGAAHMPDMARRLQAMGFSPVSTRWNMTWDLTIRADQPSAMEKVIDSVFDAVGSEEN